MEACYTLANNSRRSDEAQELAAESLSNPNPPPLVVAWALTRGYPVNEKKIIRSFENLFEDRKGNINHLITVANLRLHRNQNKKARKLLEKYAGQFDDDDEKKRLEELKVLITGEAEGISTVSILNDENISDTIAKLPKGEQHSITLWEIAETFASANRWNDVFQIRLLLTKTIKTALAYEMAAIAAFNTQNFQEAATILSSAKTYYPKQELPHRLCRMEIEAAQLSGDFFLAKKLSQSLAWTSGDTDDRVKSVDIKLIIGDKKGAQAHQTLTKNPNISKSSALTISFTL